MEQVQILQDVIAKFCRSSGQKVNEQKSVIMFSKNVSNSLARSISHELRFKLTKQLGKYLGTQLVQGRFSKDYYKELIVKVETKLSRWKASSMSLAGRATLARSVLQSIPVFSMQTALLPRLVIQKLDKAVRDFIWGEGGEKRKLHLLSWEQICRPRSKGGLGLNNLASRNEALVMKLVWRYRQEPNALWA